MSFEPGARVRVASRPHDGHTRTPAYLKGQTGVVERVQPTFTDPETRAYGSDGLPERRVYLVGFEQRELWQSYGGQEGDRLLADVFEHWLERA